jgi:hypothetical protein
MPRIGAGSLGTPGSGGGIQVRTDTFANSGTFSKPSWAKYGTFIVIGGQGGGGSGRRGAAASARFGGGSAGVPAYVIETFPSSSIDGAGTITIAAAAAGGAAVTTDNTDGNTGATGVATTVLVSTINGITLAARGSTGGLGGTAAAGAAGGANSGMYIAVTGMNSSITGAPIANSAAMLGPYGSTPGAGGGIDAADVARAGGNSGTIMMVSGFISTGGVVDGAVPQAGQITTYGNGSFIIQSGGGGAASVTTAAQAGGLGGGGGGASLNGNNSGKGGDGLGGIVIIVWEG